MRVSFSSDAFVQKKSNVIMFVGLQGAGKTTTVTKMASYYKRKVDMLFVWIMSLIFAGMVCGDGVRGHISSWSLRPAEAKCYARRH